MTSKKWSPSKFFGVLCHRCQDFGILSTMYGIILFMLYHCIIVLLIASSENKIMIFISLLYLFA